MEIEMYDVVKLVSVQVVEYESKEFNLRKGQVGVVVETYNDECLVEIETDRDTIYALIKKVDLDIVESNK